MPKITCKITEGTANRKPRRFNKNLSIYSIQSYLIMQCHLTSYLRNLLKMHYHLIVIVLPDSGVSTGSEDPFVVEGQVSDPVAVGAS